MVLAKVNDLRQDLGLDVRKRNLNAGFFVIIIRVV